MEDMIMANLATARRPLPSLPALPKGRNATAWNNCRCGCGGGTQSTFVPGHDSRLRGAMLRVIRGVLTLDQIEEFLGEGTRKATEQGLKDRALLKRWNLDAEIRAAEEARKAQEEEEAENEPETDDDENDEDDEEGETANA